MSSSKSRSVSSSQTQVTTTNQDNRSFTNITNNQDVTPEVVAEIATLASESFSLAGDISSKGLQVGALAIQQNTSLAQDVIEDAFELSALTNQQLGEVALQSSDAISSVVTESIEGFERVTDRAISSGIEAQGNVLENVSDFIFDQTEEGKNLKFFNVASILVLGLGALLIFKKS